MPELQSEFAAQDAPSGLLVAALRVHSPVATLQLPELQSAFVTQAAPSGACADAVPIFAAAATAMAAAATSFVIMAANDRPCGTIASLDLRGSDILAPGIGECQATSTTSKSRPRKPFAGCRHRSISAKLVRA
jgi:hypothetical protein